MFILHFYATEILNRIMNEYIIQKIMKKKSVLFPLKMFEKREKKVVFAAKNQNYILNHFTKIILQQTKQ